MADGFRSWDKEKISADENMSQSRRFYILGKLLIKMGMETNSTDKYTKVRDAW